MVQECKRNKKKIKALRTKLKVSQQKSRRLKKKVESLSDIIKQLKDKHLISSNCEEALHRTLTGVPLEIFQRMQSTSKSGKGVKYPPTLRSFALTLQFYSTKAYNFVRKTFNLALPHPAQIRKWYSKIPADPGFTEPTFQALSAKVNDAKEKGRTVLCSLMLDEMAIRKHVSLNGGQLCGYVDLGNGAADDDSAPVAADALVLMAVSLNDSWKVPCAYFFVNGLSGEERANLIQECIQRLHDAGAKVVSLTCDGPSCHFSMLRHLGVILDPATLKAYFVHPSDPHNKIYVFLDICHMLKLVRNTLGTGGVFIDQDGNKILWQYFVELQKLQDKEGLRLGNKLKLAHIKWQQQR